MTKRAVITQTNTKRITASAISEAKERNGWSNGDAGDALGCGEGTIRNRLEADDPKHQMTVYELLRSIDADGPHIANRILGAVDFRAMPKGCTSAPDALALAGSQARCAAELIAAVPGGIDRNEAFQLLPLVVTQQASLAALETLLRSIIDPNGSP